MAKKARNSKQDTPGWMPTHPIKSMGSIIRRSGTRPGSKQKGRFTISKELRVAVRIVYCQY